MCCARKYQGSTHQGIARYDPPPEGVGMCGVPLLRVADDGSDLDRNVGLLSSLLLLLLCCLCHWLVHHVHDMALEAQEAAYVNRPPVAGVKEWQQVPSINQSDKTMLHL
jgi:hypothetical protein